MFKKNLACEADPLQNLSQAWNAPSTHVCKKGSQVYPQILQFRRNLVQYYASYPRALNIWGLGKLGRYWCRSPRPLVPAQLLRDVMLHLTTSKEE